VVGPRGNALPVAYAGARMPEMALSRAGIARLSQTVPHLQSENSCEGVVTYLAVLLASPNMVVRLP
jgi:hypothetical protein